MYKRKEDILNDFEELELTEFGDFKIKAKYISNYEIIDFHCHVYNSIMGYIPKVFRRPIHNLNSSFFDLSCYPILTKYFRMDKVLFTDYPNNKIDLLKMKFILTGLGGYITVLRTSIPSRLKRDMELNGVSKAVVLQINSPKLDCMESMKKIVDNDDALLTFGSIHPLEREIERKIELNKMAGVLGWKINPHVNGVNIDSNECIRLLKLLNETNMPIISCSGLSLPIDRLNIVPRQARNSLDTQNINRFKNVLATIPDLKLIFAHSGVYQYKEVIELMKQYPNTYADISTQPYENIRLLIDEVGSERLLFGTDYPAFNHAISILSVLKATDNENDRNNIFLKNAKQLLNI